MIMKAKIIEQAKDLEYALYANEDKSLILIATKVGAYLHGTVRFSSSNLYKIGHYSEGWIASHFTISQDKVVLSNV